MSTVTRMHLSVYWAYIVRHIEADNGIEMLVDWPGTPEEAVAELRRAASEEGIEWYPIGDCDKRGPDGRCLGHPVEDDKQD